MPVSKKRRPRKSKSRTQARRKPTPPEPVATALPLGFATRRVGGWLFVGLGVLVILVNFIAELGIDVMPGGHEELYFVAGLVGVAAGAWLLGVFDQPAA